MEFDQKVISEVIEATGASARGEEPTELPHPMATDALLIEHLSGIGSHLIIGQEPLTPRTTKEKLADRASGRDPAQESFNSHVAHVLHQLDHRGQYQRREIAELRAELAAANEQIIQLQRRLDRLDPGPDSNER